MSYLVITKKNGRFFAHKEYSLIMARISKRKFKRRYGVRAWIIKQRKKMPKHLTETWLNLNEIR